MDDQTLGHLEPVELREIWTTEATDFTPWLARAGNIAVLAETLGIDLEVEAQEKVVGPFRADILCKDINTDTWVLIENQLERTDHKHLGQLLTYAAGLQAVTIVWVSANFTDEHRATLDWLNKITDENFRFFGLEVELWRIGNSPAAPKFNVVSKPNDWSRQAARAFVDSGLSETKIKQREYWDKFHSVLNSSPGPISSNRKPQPQSWMYYGIGRNGFRLGAAMIRQKNQIRAELYIYGDEAKMLLAVLKQQRNQIEKELGYSLEWEKLPTRRDSRIAIYLNEVNPDDESDWTRQHKWLAKHLNEMHSVFSERIKTLDIFDLANGDE